MKETAFELATSNIRYGPGVTQEVGMDVKQMGAKRVMVVADPNLCDIAPVQTVLEALKKQGIDCALYDRVRIEPTDESMKDAIEFASSGPFDAFVAVGGGSTIDTAKAADLYSTYPPKDFLDYANHPVGKDLAVPGALKPLIAVPTTAGTGSETTGVIVFDCVDIHAKTGIAHKRLRPALALLDPDNTRTLPPAVAASTGFDVLCHAIESYTAIPYTEQPHPGRPDQRPLYQGCNPISDIWSMQSLRMAAEFLARAVEDSEDEEARGNMLLAASYAGMGFGSAGVHLPHAMSLPVGGMARDYRPEGYKVDHAMIPHGMAVVLNAPAAFRFLGPASPARHLGAAEALGADISGARDADAGEILADKIIEYMQRLKMPNGLGAVGFTREDIPALVKGTLPQQRILKLMPRAASEEDLAQVFEDALAYW
ncbi:MAG: hydroxyacid-oxoacid transhydrogenase [Planctomycetia bacterium]|nr:hydroxyacid-oxoacid transhydrogenase [Planctomycetia bacterium]